MSQIDEYLELLERKTIEAYDLASKARSKGYDPDTKPEIVLAKNLAERVIGLISVVAPQLRDSGAIARIVELEEEYGILDWRVAFQISLEVALEKFCKFNDKKEAMEVGIRVGFAYVTLGAVSAPLEGFTKLELKERLDGQGTYFCLYFAGPVRAAGGTAAAVCVLIADYVRVKMGYQEYDPTELEIKRCHPEITDYHEWITNLQYFPSEEEIEFLVRNLPVEISGDPSEKYEVSNVNLKDLPRVPTNRLRSGYCLMYSGVLPLKAPKVWAKLGKWASSFSMSHWVFMEEFLKIQKNAKAKEATKKESKSEVKIKPDYTYIADLVAGRPVFGYPLNNGGFRLRYGRGRTSGYSAQAVNPATMYILNDFIALATQLKVERPGKAAAFTSCDSIDGPIVKLKDGSVIQVDDVADAKLLKPKVAEVLYLGDLLINYGDFFDRAHPLVPAGYVEEEWILEFERAAAKLFGTIDAEKIAELTDIDVEKIRFLFSNPIRAGISYKAAAKISTTFKIPLHPKHIFYWNSITSVELLDLAEWVSTGILDASKLSIPNSHPKRMLELIGAPHRIEENQVVVEGELTHALLGGLGVADPNEITPKLGLIRSLKEHSSLEIVNQLSGMHIRDKCGTFIGARMGRPEKAKIRKLASSPHTLFPVGAEGGKFRSIQSALEKGKITAQFAPFYCKNCKRETPFSVCDQCDKTTEQKNFCPNCGLLPKDIKVDKTFDAEGNETVYHVVGSGRCNGKITPYKTMTVPIAEAFPKFLKMIDTNIFPDLIKGVKGTSNKEHIPEHLIKGILRAKHNLYVNKDGTIRYDCSEIPITHFKPAEIGVNFEKLKTLGYLTDIHGQPLVSDNQILEIFPQDILLPCNPISPEEPADSIMFRTANFTDELLEKLYKVKPYYKLKTPDDLVGHMAIGLAPHTSAGILCRIIGFSKTQGFLAHPYIHAAMRRDCFTADTYLPFKKNGVWTIEKIGDLVEKINPTKLVDRYGTLEARPEGYTTIGVVDGKEKEVPVDAFTKHSPMPIIELRTKLGKSLRTTSNHKHIILRHGQEIIVKSDELQLGDVVKLPYNVNVESQDVASINLLEELEARDWLMVRGLKELMPNIRAELKSVGVEGKDLDNFSIRDSIPAKLAMKIMSKNRIEAKQVRLSARRDSVSVPAIIPLTDEFLECIGLYVAEGYARQQNGKKGSYQIYIAAQREEIRQFVQKVFSELGLSPSERKKDRVTYSSRIIYELFTSILQTGKSAYEKRLPSRFLSLPPKRLGKLLSGYLEGDGSVSTTDLRIVFDTVSKGLMHDLEFVFARLGAFLKFRTSTRQPGAAVRAFYERKGREVPFFTCTRGIIQSKFVHLLGNYIRFLSQDKQGRFMGMLTHKKFRNLFCNYDSNYFYDEIVELGEQKPETTYCLSVENHTVVANGILTKQCDGDEGCILLLMDALLNFSKKYLPETRGSTMDAPLVLTYVLNPAEVDDMVFNLDIAWRYPLELYEAARKYKMPWEVKVKLVSNVLRTPLQYYGMGFTHDTSDINEGVLCSAYKLLPSMEDKLKSQMDLAEKIRAVDASDVAKLVIDKHFMKDTKGNLRKFSQQEFRCVECNEKYRRPPLAGKCTKCNGGKLIFTVSEGFVIKYLQVSMQLAEKYKVSNYLKQTLELLQQRVESVFGKDAERQEGLGAWLSA